MKEFLFFTCIVLLLCNACGGNSGTTSTSDIPDSTNVSKTYTNPVVRKSLPDPTVIKANDGYFYVYATEDTRNIPIYKSKDLVNWTFVGTAFTDGTRPTFVVDGGLWAPDIKYINGKYVLYYAMSTWGGEWTCGIGIAVADKPEGPFTDHGKLFTSSDMGVQDSIDEFYIEENGHKYLFWGSFHGIYGIELSDDGLSIKSGAEKRQIAGTFMEGTYIHKRGSYYYLFGSTGTCCEGDASTYHVVYGRSNNLFGPYTNKEGGQLLDNNFDILIQGNYRYAGPGHNAEFVTDDAGEDWMLFHSYIRGQSDLGRCLMLVRIQWDDDDWPYVKNSVPPVSDKLPVFNTK